MCTFVDALHGCALSLKFAEVFSLDPWLFLFDALLSPALKYRLDGFPRPRWPRNAPGLLEGGGWVRVFFFRGFCRGGSSGALLGLFLFSLGVVWVVLVVLEGVVVFLWDWALGGFGGFLRSGVDLFLVWFGVVGWVSFLCVFLGGLFGVCWGVVCGFRLGVSCFGFWVLGGFLVGGVGGCGALFLGFLCGGFFGWWLGFFFVCFWGWWLVFFFFGFFFGCCWVLVGRLGCSPSTCVGSFAPFFPIFSRRLRLKPLSDHSTRASSEDLSCSFAFRYSDYPEIFLETYGLS